MFYILDIRNNYLKRQYKEMRDVRVVFYMYIDAQQILCELVVQHTCADRNKKTIWIPHWATHRVLRTPGLKLLNREGNPYKFLVRWSSRRLPFVLFYNHQWSLARRHSHLPSLLLPRLNQLTGSQESKNIILLYYLYMIMLLGVVILTCNHVYV